MKYDCAKTCPSRKPLTERLTRALCHIANLTHRHPVGEGFIPPVHPTPSPTKRFVRADASIRPYKLGVPPNKSPTCTLPKNPPRNLWQIVK